jgi:plasmid maintenance system antidote protein VapI
LAAKEVTIPDQLRDAIAASGLSSTAIAEKAVVDRRQVDRFVTGERDIRFEAAGRIGQALGLELKEPVKPRGRPKKASRSPSVD